MAGYYIDPAVKWIKADPSQLASQKCRVYCVNSLNHRLNFNTTISTSQLLRKFESFDCYCNRSYILFSVKRRVRYSFLVKRGLILRGRGMHLDDVCSVQSRNLIALNRGDEGFNVEWVIKYDNVFGECPNMQCKPSTKSIAKTSILYWDLKQHAVQFYPMAGYKRKVAFIDCYGHLTKVVNFG